MTNDEAADFVFYKSTEAGAARLASMKCSSLGIQGVAPSTVWIDAVEHDSTPYIAISNCEIKDSFIALNSSLSDVKVDKAEIKELSIKDGGTAIIGKDGHIVISSNVSVGDIEIANATITGTLTMDEDAVLNRKLQTLILWDPEANEYRNIFDIFSKKES
jgi:hypothetical protein